MFVGIPKVLTSTDGGKKRRINVPSEGSEAEKEPRSTRSPSALRGENSCFYVVIGFLFELRHGSAWMKSCT